MSWFTSLKDVMWEIARSSLNVCWKKICHYYVHSIIIKSWLTNLCILIITLYISELTSVESDMCYKLPKCDQGWSPGNNYSQAIFSHFELYLKYLANVIWMSLKIEVTILPNQLTYSLSLCFSTFQCYFHPTLIADLSATCHFRHPSFEASIHICATI